MNITFILLAVISLIGCSNIKPLSLSERVDRKMYCSEPYDWSLVQTLESDDVVSQVAKKYIKDGDNEGAEDAYIESYENGLLPDFSLLQLFFIYSSWYNVNRDMEKAVEYATKLKEEFPESRALIYLYKKMPEYYLNC
jgi:hypothetical protein